MKYGYFDDERKEYVITDPRTPLPWINYLGSDDLSPGPQEVTASIKMQA